MEQTQIIFSKEKFNPIYWHIRQALRDITIRFIYAYGGSSAGKTYTVCQAIILEMLTNPFNTIVFRKFSSDIEDTIYSDFKSIIADWGLQDEFRCIKHKIICANGSYIRFKGLDDSEKVKGIAGFKKVVLEEVTQMTHEDFKQIRKRLRGMEGQQIICMWNPIDEFHWLKKNIFDKDSWIEQTTDLPKKHSWRTDIMSKKMNEKGNAVILRTNYQNNWFIMGHPKLKKEGYLDQHVIDDFNKDKQDDYAFWLIYAWGEWGKLDVGGEFYKRFNYQNNTAELKYNPVYPLHISFDENVNPHMTCTVWQMIGKKLMQIDEICLETPRNTLRATCNEFMSRYAINKNGLFIYGDATSWKQDAKLEKGKNFYSQVMEHLTDYNPTMRVPRSNPSVVLRGNFINDVFADKFDGCEIVLGRNCIKSIADVNYLKEDSDGTKFKKKVMHPVTKVRYEEWGHTSDSQEYIACFVFKDSLHLYDNGTKGKTLRKFKRTIKTHY